MNERDNETEQYIVPQQPQQPQIGGWPMPSPQAIKELTESDISEYIDDLFHGTLTSKESVLTKVTPRQAYTTIFSFKRDKKKLMQSGPHPRSHFKCNAEGTPKISNEVLRALDESERVYIQRVLRGVEGYERDSLKEQVTTHKTEAMITPRESRRTGVRAYFGGGR